MIPYKIRTAPLVNLIILLFHLPNYAQEPLAMTSSYSGRVFVVTKEGRTLENREALLKLYEGQSIQTDSNASATILYFSNGKPFPMSALQRHVIQASGSKKTPPKRTRLDALKALRQPKRLPHGSRKGLGDPPVLLYPCEGKVLSTTPVFAWLSSGPDTVYEAKLFRDDGPTCKITGTLLWQKTSQDTTLKYPEDMAALHASQKYWIEIKRFSHEDAEDYGCFTIASVKESKEAQKQQKAIQKQYGSNHPKDVTAEVVYASYLIEEKFYTDAYELLKQALLKQPQNVALHALMGQLYEEVKLDKLLIPLPE